MSAKVFIGSLVLALFLLQFAGKADSAKVFNEFKKVSKCPTDQTKKVDYVNSRIECGGVCNLRPTCDSFSFEPSKEVCFLGEACSSEEEQWKEGNCEAFVYNGLAETGGDVADKSTQPNADLQLQLLYKFRRSGLLNSVNPRRHCLKVNDSTVDGNGARVWGRRSSHLSTVSSEFKSYFNGDTSYSIYLSLKCKLTSNLLFWSFVKPDMTSDAGIQFLISGHFLMYRSLSPSGISETAFFDKEGLTPSDTEVMSNISIGMVVNGSAPSAYERYIAYINGNLQFVRSSTGDYEVAPESFHRLLLGASHNSDIININGTLLCFGLSTKLFLKPDFDRLEAICAKK